MEEWKQRSLQDHTECHRWVQRQNALSGFCFRNIILEISWQVEWSGKKLKIKEHKTSLQKTRQEGLLEPGSWVLSPEFGSQQVWGGARRFTCLASSQGMLVLLVWDHTFFENRCPAPLPSLPLFAPNTKLWPAAKPFAFCFRRAATPRSQHDGLLLVIQFSAQMLSAFLTTGQGQLSRAAFAPRPLSSAPFPVLFLHSLSFHTSYNPKSFISCILFYTTYYILFHLFHLFIYESVIHPHSTLISNVLPMHSCYDYY